MSRPKGHPSFRTSDPTRFWEKVLVGDGCWEWQAATLVSGFPYGLMSWRGRNRLAHRIAWELHHGEPPPAELNVLHACDNPRCVRPDHLFLGTQRDNILDRNAKGRGVYPLGLRTHCSRGHMYDEVNTYRTARGKRVCRTCHREYERKRREEARAQ